MNNLIFITLNNLSNDGGGTIRIKSLFRYSVRKRNSILVSNQNKIKNINNELFLDVEFNSNEKRLFQLLITFFPVYLVKLFFLKKLNKIECFFNKKLVPLNGDYVFCEYLDNSIGYYLKRRGIINNYINDLHGIATNEFINKQSGFRYWNRIKYYVAKKHDGKVLSMASAHIFASESMKLFFYNNYPKFRHKKYFYIPYLLDSSFFDVGIDKAYQLNICNQHNLDKFSHIIFYAGAYKEIGGVVDLIETFNIVLRSYPESGLVLVGGGRCQDLVDKKIRSLGLSDRVIQLGYQPYNKLFTLQQIANVIVCPDRNNLYSNLIVHLKYFDSVASEKPVVCGSFDAVNEINPNDDLSLSYEPSNLLSMSLAIKKALDNNNELMKLSKGKRKLVLHRFTYNSYEETICSIET